LACGGAEDAATSGRVEEAKAFDFDGDRKLARFCGDGPASSADRLAGEEKLGK